MLLCRLSLASLDVKLEAARKILAVVFMKPSAPVMFAKQVSLLIRSIGGDLRMVFILKLFTDRLARFYCEATHSSSYKASRFR